VGHTKTTKKEVEKTPEGTTTTTTTKHEKKTVMASR
jgi:hypothetical protein